MNVPINGVLDTIMEYSLISGYDIFSSKKVRLHQLIFGITKLFAKRISITGFRDCSCIG